MIQVEIACNSFTSCLNAVAAGADRIELFENLSDGGCSPSAGMIHKVKSLNVPVYVMIRPRGGNFTYSSDEIDIMFHDIEMCKEAGIEGIVFGCLQSNGEIDKALNKSLLQAWNGRATFHRAIDRCNNMYQSAKTVVELGFERILSSGGAKHVENGLDVLKKLNTDFGKDIIIMPGAGVNSRNVKRIIEYTNCTEIHATCKIEISSLSAGAMQFDDKETISDLHEIENLIKALS